MAAEFTVSYMSEEDANWFRENSRFIGQRDYNSGMEAATRRGVEQGLQQGLKQGLKQGERKTALKNAENLLKLNLLTPEQIAQAVELPLEEVLKLKGKVEP